LGGRLAWLGLCAVLTAAIVPEALAQPRGWGSQAQQPVVPPPSGSRGENFSAGKPASQLFASDCTGAGCHRGPQGLAKDRSQFGLASFLREHYTNSRESAAALASYLAALPAARQQPDPSSVRPPRPAARPGDDVTRPPDEVPGRGRRPGEPAEAEARPTAPAAPPPARTQRGRQQTTAAPPPVEAPPPPPPPPPKPEFDIFD
jgi:hypothetical protein